MIKQMARKARNAAIEIANAASEEKNRAITKMADAIEKNKDKILQENKKDLAEAEKAKLTKAIYNRLKLDNAKIKEMVAGLRDLSKLEDPIGKTLSAIELDKNLELFKVSVPIGVIGAIFESRPDVVPQISSLCLKSGNAVILKGGSEAKHSNKILADILSKAALEAGMPENCINLIETREQVQEILKLDDYIDLLVPRGSNRFVKYIQDNSRIPVLGHSEGICHIFVDRDADMEKAVNIVFDAKTQYPAACNAVETLLIDEKIAEKFLLELKNKLDTAGVEIRGDKKTCSIINAKKATEQDWSTEYTDLIISVRIVKDVDEAIDHINNFSSGHTDSIITENNKTALRFLNFVDSACVFRNASTRFSDGFRFGMGAEVGISTNKIHARGPVGLEGLVIYKYILMGNGQTVASYTGKDAKKFLHKKLNKEWKK